MSWEENIFFFILFGILGMALEIFCTSLENQKKKKDRCLKGTSSLWMFFIYGSAYFAILFVTTYFSNLNILVRGLIYMLLFYALEFCSGYFLKTFKAIPWDYSDDTKYHFKGIIRLEFAPMWFIGGLLAEAIYLYFKAHLIF
jgi:uncharacterized membrane protein